MFIQKSKLYYVSLILATGYKQYFPKKEIFSDDSTQK